MLEKLELEFRMILINYKNCISKIGNKLKFIPWERKWIILLANYTVSTDITRKGLWAQGESEEGAHSKTRL